VQHPAVQSKLLELMPGGFLTSPSILLDEKPVEGWKGQYVVRGDDGEKVPIEMKKKFLDPVPTLVIDGTPIEVVRPLKWHQYVWICLPLCLVAIGGLLGALAGFVGAYANARIFRSGLPTVFQYLLSAIVTGLALLLYLAFAAAFAILVQGCSAS
jgi:hypothetical protein